MRKKETSFFGILDKLVIMMQSLSIYARLFARALSNAEAENIILNSLLRLSSSSSRPAIANVGQRLAITSPTSAINRSLHLVTVSSGYSGDERNLSSLTKHRNNVFGDDAFFITKNRLGDFLGEKFLFAKKDVFNSNRISLLFFFSGVADGVGSWHEQGIDPSLFSSSLMDTCKSLIDNKLIDLNPLTLKELLSKSYKQLLENKKCIIGTNVRCFSLIFIDLVRFFRQQHRLYYRFA